MNRTWLAVILGIILGFVLMGMMLRGCEVGADTSSLSSSNPTRPDAPSSRLASRLQSRVAATPESGLDFRSTFGTESPTPASATQSRFVSNADGQRNSSQRLNPVAARPGTEFGFAQAMAESRNPQGRPIRAADSNATIVNEVNRRQALLDGRRGAGSLRPDEQLQQALQARAMAESELLRQIEREQRQTSAAERRAGLAEGAEEGASEGEIEGESGDSARDAFFDEGTRASNVTVNSGGGFGGGTVVPPVDTGDGDGDGDGSGDGDGIDETPIGGGDTDEGEGNGDDGDTDGPPDIDIPPVDGGEPGDGGGSTEPQVVARWLPVDVEDECGSLSGTRTNDLYLGFRDPLGLQIVTSAPPVSLDVVGGSFHQDQAGGNTAPSAQTLELFPCAAFDSYLTIGEAEGVFLPTSLNAADWGTQLNAVWVTPTSQPFGSIGARDRDQFGDDRFYVRVGRFTATGNPEFIGGTLVVNAFDISRFSVETEIVSVPYEPELWSVEGAAGVGLVSFDLESSTVLSGQYILGTVALSAPAPAGGVRIEFESSSSAVQPPAFVLVEEGRTSSTFLIPTSVVFTDQNVTLSAHLNSTTVFASLALQAQPTEELLASISVDPTVVRGRMTSTGLVTLGSPAPAGGQSVVLGSDDLTIANVPSHVVVPEGETEATFTIETGVVTTSQYVEIWAVVEDQIRTTTLTVTILGDIDGDGTVNGADLAELLARWNSDDELADMNGDGVVNGADIADLLSNFNASSTPSGAPVFDGSVIARWVPVEQTGDCEELEGSRTNDLYLGFELQPDIPGGPVISSEGASQLFMTGGQVRQDPLGGNAPPSNAFLNLAPCLEFDSYLTIGGASPTFLPNQIPNPSDWGSALNAGWFTTEFDSISIEQNPAKFGDAKHYIRIGRLTADEGIRIDGELIVNFTSGGASQPTALVPVAQCPICWISFDLNEDGLIDSGDVEFVVARMGTTNDEADLDRDGVVTGRDLELIVGEASDPKSP